MIRYLSYLLSHAVPACGSVEKNIELREIKSLEKGDSCCTYWVGLENHWGTHVDCPAHFFADGMQVDEYGADFWFFRNPQVLSIHAEPGQIIGVSELSSEINPEADLLLLKSGWGKFRGKDIYSLRGPGLDPLVGMWLRKNYPSLRAVGLDWISLSSHTNRKLGREAHRVFLNPESEGRPIVLIEDMFLPEDMENLKQVWVAPLRVEGIDSAPCTVIGVFE